MSGFRFIELKLKSAVQYLINRTLDRRSRFGTGITFIELFLEDFITETCLYSRGVLTFFFCRRLRYSSLNFGC